MSLIAPFDFPSCPPRSANGLPIAANSLIRFDGRNGSSDLRILVPVSCANRPLIPIVYVYVYVQFDYNRIPNLTRLLHRLSHFCRLELKARADRNLKFNQRTNVQVCGSEMGCWCCFESLITTILSIFRFCDSNSTSVENIFCSLSAQTFGYRKVNFQRSSTRTGRASCSFALETKTR